ncbi:MAG: methylmalonyl-CoA epimerase [Planctomycetota bacterium]|nr:methylmalonyl-CoA epimerase [Planctomycetota bacterium]
MITALHHIGIAVESIEASLPRWTEGLGLPLHSIEEVESEGVKVAVVMVGEVRVELLEPTGPDSAVARFLDKRGPGIHHLAFAVDSTGEMIEVLIEAEAPVLDKEPRVGADGTKVAFMHPSFLGGVLAEFVEELK